MVFYFPTLPQQSNITRHQDEPEIPDSVRRSTENEALRRTAARARIQGRVGSRMVLSHLHMELMRFERAALQYLPHLDYDERMEFIAGAARLRNITARQIAALLDQASDILMLREMNGVSTQFDDLSEKQARSLHWGTIRYSERRTKRPIPKGQAALPAA